MELIVETKYGKVEGFTEKGINKWFGIPYAKPPVGELRFRRTVECEPWEGVKPCKKFGNRCEQFMKSLTSFSNHPQSEDCLYLNIWRKDSDQKNLPVFVWVHGGYLHYGESSDKIYDGTHFAEEGVIYINFNYRLGPLGCYDFSYYNKDKFDSNCCLADQIMALRWVKDNIEAFGGDPNNITIAGESSGGASVCALLASPVTKGLFNKVICQSGLPEGFHSKVSLKYDMDLFLEYLGVTPENIDDIITMDIGRFKKATNLLFKNLSKVYPGSFMPGIRYDDDLFPEDCFECVKHGNTEGVKLIIGTCLDEGSFFYLTNTYPNTWKKVKEYCDLCKFEKDFSEVEKVYANKTEKQKVIDVNTDLLFLIGSIKLAEQQCINNDVWMYQFNYAPRLLRLAGLNATHGIDNSMCHKNATKDYLWYMTPSGPKNQLMNEIFGCWVSFTKTGNPNGDHLKVKWEKYDPNKRKTLYFDQNTTLVENPVNDRYELWKDLKACYRE